MNFWSKKRWAGIGAAVLTSLLCVLPGASRAEETETADAAKEPLACSFTLHEANAGQEERLIDGDVATCMRVRSDRTIVMALPAAAGQLYIAWHEAPVSPLLSFSDAAGATISTEEPDASLLYQSFSIPSGAKSATLSAAKDFAVSEFAAYKTLPEEQLLPQPTPQKTDVLLIAAHTGDEFYYFGGLLPLFAGEKDYAVTVLFLSHPSRVAQEEAMLSLRACGIETQPLFQNLNYRLHPFGTNAAARLWNGDAAAKAIARAIRACAPEIVVTHSASGEDGDVMHAYASALTREAIRLASRADELSADAGEPALWEPAALYEHTEAGGIALPVDTQLPAFDGATARALAQSCFFRYSSLKTYHKSAHAAETPYYVLCEEYRDTDVDPFHDLLIDPMPTPEPEATPTPAPTPTATPEPVKSRADGYAAFASFCGWTQRHCALIMGLCGLLSAAGVLLVALRRMKRALLYSLLCCIPLALGALASFALPAANDAKLAAIEAAATPTPSPTPTPTPVPTAEPTPTPDPADAYFRSESDPAEVVLFDNENGSYAYRSDTLSVEIQRHDIRNNNDQPVRYFVAHLRMREENSFRPGYGTYRENGRDPSDPFVMARRYKAVVAITGDNMIHSDEKNKALIVRSGRMYLDNRGGSTMVFTPDGMGMYIQPGNTLYAQDLLDMGIENSFSFGPMLIQDGVVNEHANEHYLSGYNPRVGVGFVEEGHFVLIVVEGRVGKYSRGVRMSEFAQLFMDEGCTQAYNLDGGASSCLLFMGEYLNRRMPNQYRDIPDLLMWGYSELVPGPDEKPVNATFYTG